MSFVEILTYVVHGGIILLILYSFLRAVTGFKGLRDSERPVLASQDMISAGPSLESMHRAEAAGFAYNMLAGRNGKLMVFVDLGHDTAMHILAVGSKSQAAGELVGQLNDKFLRAVELEGDFPNYFKLYCTPDKQVELRTLLDPADMQRLVDFCQAYAIEIFRDQLFVSQFEMVHDSDDSTTLIADVEEFLKNNARLLRKI